VTIDEYWQVLTDAGWVAHLSKKKQSEVRARVAALLPQGKRNVVYALAAVVIDAECIDAEDDYRNFLLALADASDEVFAPTNIKIKFDYNVDVAKIAFKHAGKPFRFEIPLKSDWFEMEVLDHVNDALAVSEAESRFIPLPGVDQMLLLAFVPPSVYGRASKAKLIPKADSYLAHLLARENGTGAVKAKNEQLAELKSKDAATRMLAVMNLGSTKAKAKNAFPLLLEALQDKAGIVRRVAAESMVRVGEKAVPALEAALTDPDDLVKIVAASSLWIINNHPAAFPLLLEFVRREQEPSVNWAFSSLAKLEPEPNWALPLVKEAFLASHRAFVVNIVTVIERLGPRAAPTLPFLLAVMKEDGATAKSLIIAAELISRIGPEAHEAVPDLIKLLHNEDQEMREMAIYALGQIGPAAKDALPLVEKILSTTHPNYYLRDTLKLISGRTAATRNPVSSP
jgi:HEAT repeat protein